MNFMYIHSGMKNYGSAGLRKFLVKGVLQCKSYEGLDSCMFG